MVLGNSYPTEAGDPTPCICPCWRHDSRRSVGESSKGSRAAALRNGTAAHSMTRSALFNSRRKPCFLSCFLGGRVGTLLPRHVLPPSRRIRPHRSRPLLSSGQHGQACDGGRKPPKGSLLFHIARLWRTQETGLPMRAPSGSTEATGEGSPSALYRLGAAAPDG
jgi:hypothetical protein